MTSFDIRSAMAHCNSSLHAFITYHVDWQCVYLWDKLFFVTRCYFFLHLMLKSVMNRCYLFIFYNSWLVEVFGPSLSICLSHYPHLTSEELSLHNTRNHEMFETWGECQKTFLARYLQVILNCTTKA